MFQGSSLYTSRRGGRLNETGGNVLMNRAALGAEGSEVMNVAVECSSVSL